MPVLCNSGRAVLAAALRDKQLYLTWGAGLATWETDHQQILVFAADDTLALGHPHVSAVALASPDGLTPYTADLDFAVAPATGLVTRLANGGIAAQAQVQVTWHVDTAPAVDDAAGLIDLVGIRAITASDFVVPDPDGPLAVLIDGTQQNFAVSPAPTPHLYIYTQWDFADSADAVIRELALVTGPAFAAGLPAGQRYFTGADITDPGTLVLLEHTPALVRSPALRESFAWVFTV